MSAHRVQFALTKSSFSNLTAIRVGLRAVTILQSVIPSALVLGTAGLTDARPVSAFKSVRPLSFVDPMSLGLHT